jgi:hypothetical protein
MALARGAARESIREAIMVDMMSSTNNNTTKSEEGNSAALSECEELLRVLLLR